MAHAQEVLDDLTDEEREAIATYDAEQTELKAQGGATDVNEDEPQAEDAADDAQAEDESEPAADPVAAAGADDAQPAVDAEPVAEATPEAQPAAAEVKQPQSAPILVLAAPEDADAKLADIATKKAELTQQWEDGIVTGKEYQTELDALNDQQFEIRAAVREANMAAEMENQRINREWTASCERFLNANPAYRDEKRQALLSDYIKALANVSSNATLTNEQALAKAHRMVQVDLGEEVTAAPAAQPAKVTQHKVPKPEVPPNIGNLPAAGMQDTGGGEFASLDRLQSTDPIAYEDKLMSMSQVQRDRYLRA